MTEMESSEKEDVALAVHNILENTGLSEYEITLYKSNLLYIAEKLCKTIFMPYEFTGGQLQPCGSFQEGMILVYASFGLKADIDMLFILCKSKAYEERTVVTSTDEYQYFIQNCEDYPGYVTLQLVKEGSLVYFYLSTFYGPYERGDDNHNYLSNFIKDKIAMFGALADIHNIVQLSDLFPLIGTHHQGPSIEHNLVGATLGQTNGFELEKTDVVYAIPCPQWPSIAKEWITRERKYGWPTTDLITKIKRLGACLVPIGYKGSSTERLQWKYSFSHSEKHLIWSLNAVQFKCYAVLKLVKIFVLTPVLGDIISSYIIKTSLLWTVEGTPSNIWQPSMLLDCTKRCLMRIKNWVTKDFCPNYIMTTCNLLRNRYTENEKGLVLNSLTDLIENLENRICHIPPIMKELQENSVPELARANAVSMQAKQNLSSDPEFHKFLSSGYGVLHSLVIDMLVPSHYGYCIKNNNDLPNAISLLFMIIQNVASDVDFDNKFDLNLCVLLTAKMVVLSAMLQLSKCDRKNKQIYDLISKMKKLCQPVGKVKFLVNLLYLATIYLNMNEFHRVIEITNEIQQYFQKHLYIRADYTKALCQSSIDDAIKQFCENYDSQESSVLVNDVHFAFAEFPYLPQPIQFELLCREKTGQDTNALMRPPEEFITAIDPLVYTSFLQFWCHRQLQNNAKQLMAIRHLRERCEHAMTTHKDIAWNLLGYCYDTVGQNQDAFSAFHHALTHKRKSRASLFYMTILLHKLTWEEWNKVY